MRRNAGAREQEICPLASRGETRRLFQARRVSAKGLRPAGRDAGRGLATPLWKLATPLTPKDWNALINRLAGYDLKLMSVDAAAGLLNAGRNLIIVALVGTDLHVRIFDANGKKVIDKAENELVSGDTLTALKKRLNPFLDEPSLSKENKQEIIRNATSIAGHTSPPVDWLVLGLINEDPSQLTLGEIRERTRDTFIFGQLFGALLYEHFKTKSRMRDDLYYRIRRCGEIRVADLDQRREDIPIIFYFLLKTRTKLTRDISRDLFLTYGALRELASNRIKWKGNVRQLELAARELVNLISDRKETSAVYTVSPGDIRLALVNAKVPGASDSEWEAPNA